MNLEKKWREPKIERTEIRMLRWMLGVTLKDRKRNDDIRHAIGVCCITDKIRESRLRWYEHVQWREDDHCVKRILKAEVYGRWNRGRQRKRWINTISPDLSLNLTPVDVEDRDDWRSRTLVANPSCTKGIQQPEGESNDQKPGKFIRTASLSVITQKETKLVS